jgi:hypothetical protein
MEDSVRIEEAREIRAISAAVQKALGKEESEVPRVLNMMADGEWPQCLEVFFYYRKKFHGLQAGVMPVRRLFEACLTAWKVEPATYHVPESAKQFLVALDTDLGQFDKSDEIPEDEKETIAELKRYRSFLFDYNADVREFVALKWFSRAANIVGVPMVLTLLVRLLANNDLPDDFERLAELDSQIDPPPVVTPVEISAEFPAEPQPEIPQPQEVPAEPIVFVPRSVLHFTPDANNGHGLDQLLFKLEEFTPRTVQEDEKRYAAMEQLCRWYQTPLSTEVFKLAGELLGDKFVISLCNKTLTQCLSKVGEELNPYVIQIQLPYNVDTQRKKRKEETQVERAKRRDRHAVDAVNLYINIRNGLSLDASPAYESVLRFCQSASASKAPKTDKFVTAIRVSRMLAEVIKELEG